MQSPSFLIPFMPFDQTLHMASLVMRVKNMDKTAY